MAGEEVRFLEGRDLDAEVARAVFGLEPVCVAEEPWEECHIDRESLLNFSCNFGGAVFTDNREWVSRRLEEGTTRPAVIVRAYGWLQGTAAVARRTGGRGPREWASSAPAETAATPAPSRR